MPRLRAYQAAHRCFQRVVDLAHLQFNSMNSSTDGCPFVQHLLAGNTDTEIEVLGGMVRPQYRPVSAPPLTSKTPAERIWGASQGRGR